jgi:uncharacterized DUF497 family protein
VIFTWDDENRDHIDRHAVSPEEAEYVVSHADAPFPQNVGDDKLRVWGVTQNGRLLQVIYVLKRQSAVAYESIDTLDWDVLELNPDVKVARIVHAMDLTGAMKRQFRRLYR